VPDPHPSDETESVILSALETWRPRPPRATYEARSFLPGRRESRVREGAVASRGSRESLGLCGACELHVER